MPDECPDEAAAVCTVAAHVAWVGGDGAIARAAVERALRLAPGYRLARLLERLVETGLRLPPVTGAGSDGPGRTAGPAAGTAAEPAASRPSGPERARSAGAGRARLLGPRNASRHAAGAGTMDAGHESQCQTPVCWAATLLAVGCPG